MEKKRILIAWIVTSAIFALILLYGFYLNQNKTDLIIYYGIKAANAMVVAIVVVAIVALLISLLLFLKNYRKQLQFRQAALQAEPLVAKSYIQSEAYVRSRLEHFLGTKPRLHAELIECLQQMDSIGQKQASLREVRSRSNVAFLESVADSLEKAEHAIFKNLLAIINIAEIWNTKKAGDPGWSAVYDEQLKSIKAGIKLNDDLLKQCAILLTKGTTLANDKSLSREAENDLEATITVINQLRNMSGVDEGELNVELKGE